LPNRNGSWKKIILRFTKSNRDKIKKNIAAHTMNLPRLLLLHGALGAASQFETLKKNLASDFEILAYNFPGHGGREIPEQSFSFSLFTNDLLKFLIARKIDTINIFGYSMGGYAALWMAKHFPERVNTIFTLATKFDWNEDSSQREASMLNTEKMEEKIPAFAKALMERHAPANWKEVVNKTRDMILDLGKSHLEENDFRSIKHSVTIGVGEKDNMVSIDESRNVAALLPAGNFISFPEMQHPFEKADIDQLMIVISSFFKI
jgi:pimeloyl-ACP methyl ester carboxylesterase